MNAREIADTVNDMGKITFILAGVLLLGGGVGIYNSFTFPTVICLMAAIALLLIGQGLIFLAHEIRK